MSRPGEPSRPGQDDARRPSEAKVRGYLLYGLSLPERALRGTAGVVGGTLRESAALLVPGAFRNAKTYQVLVGQMLDFMAENIGGVEGRCLPGGDDKVENYVARKTVGNFIELASLATIHLSPMVLLALFGDLAYGSRVYLRQLAEELQRRGVIADAQSIRHVDDLLDSITVASHDLATTLDTPPLSVRGLRETIRQTRRVLAGIDPAKVLTEPELERLWESIQLAARRQGVSAFAVSGVMTLRSLERIGKLGPGALSTTRAVGDLFDRHVLDHYRMVLAEIDRNGFYPSLAVTGRPYVAAIWRNFSAERGTVTERVLDDIWNRARRWLDNARWRRS